MAKYKVQFFCDECGQTHDLHISISLNDGPVAKESIENSYAGKELPIEITLLSNNKTECPVTGKLTTQKNNNQVFLVPISN